MKAAAAGCPHNFGRPRQMSVEHVADDDYAPSSRQTLIDGCSEMRSRIPSHAVGRGSFRNEFLVFADEKFASAVGRCDAWRLNAPSTNAAFASKFRSTAQLTIS
jgi:hypothetical protein